MQELVTLPDKRAALLALRTTLHALWQQEPNAEVRCLLWTMIAASNTIIKLLRKGK